MVLTDACIDDMTNVGNGGRRVIAVLTVTLLGISGCTVPSEKFFVANKQFPPELLARAHDVLGERVVRAWEYDYEWLTGELIRFSTDSDRHAVFLHRAGEYVRVNPPGDCSVMNEILSQFTFARAEFRDPDKVDSFLGLIVSLWQGPDRYIGSSVLIRVLENSDGIDGWLGGREKDERVLLDLCEDPEFTFEQNDWTVVFNVFRANGSVDRWRVAGEFNAATQSNKMDRIAIRALKRPGTFDSAMMGSENATQGTPTNFCGTSRHRVGGCPCQQSEDILMSQIDSLPSDLVRQVKKHIGGPTSRWSVYEHEYDWLKNGRLFSIDGRHGTYAIVFTDGCSYQILNHAAEMDGINRVLASYRFSAADFFHEESLFRFLDLVVSLTSGTGGVIATDAELARLDKHRDELAEWLLGRERDEAEFRATFYAPKTGQSHEMGQAPSVLSVMSTPRSFRR